MPESVAIAEGEGDLPLDFWKTAHTQFFKPYLAELNIDDLENERVVTEHFEVIYKET